MDVREEASDEAAGADRGGAGDVESAGETTAAATTGGTNADTRPVGAGTLVEVEGDPAPEKDGRG